MKRANVLLI